MSLREYYSPEFCIIAPTNYLNYAEYGNRHLVLAHLIEKDSTYTEFYRLMSERGDFIIMDNGAFELGESYEPEKLMKLAETIKADCIVLPDYPFKPAELTINAAKKWAPVFKDNNFYTMFVPQSEIGNKQDWIKAYDWAANQENIDVIGMSILGIPNALPHIPASYARVVMAEILCDRKMFNHEKYHHWLGLNSGPKLEIPTLLEMDVLDSCDSSNPVWMGILGHQYSDNTDSFLPVSKVKAHVQFDYPATNDIQTHMRILNNIKMTQRLFNKQIIQGE